MAMLKLKHATFAMFLVSLGAIPVASTIAVAAPAAPLAATMTDPAPNARVPGPLPMVHVIFNGPVDPKASGFEITKSDGTRVDVQEVAPMGASILMATPKSPLPPGNYKVKWHTAGADAKKLEGEFSFTVQ
jgi:methionine-rich copper-binding protein CopC